MAQTTATTNHPEKSPIIYGVDFPVTLCKVDAGLLPLVNRLDLFPAFRLYLVGQQLDRTTNNGSGWIDVVTLRKALFAQFRIKYTRRQVDNLIQEGSGVFWRIRGTRLYFASYNRLWSHLLKRVFYATNDRVLADSYHVSWYVHLDVSGTLQGAKARAYSAWIEYRNKSGAVMASRFLLCALWGVSAGTLRQWEKLTGVNAIPQYSQYAGDDPKAQFSDHARLNACKNGRVMVTCRISNSYTIGNSTAIHPHKGQTNKARRIRNQVIKSLQPLKVTGEGLAYTGRTHFDAQKTQADRFKAAHKHIRKHFRAGVDYHVFLGERNGIRIFERFDLNSDLQYTELDERDFKGEKTPEFVRIQIAADTEGFTRTVRQSCWKKTEHTKLVDAYTPAHVRVTQTPLQRAIAADPVLSLAQALGAEILEHTARPHPHQNQTKNTVSEAPATKQASTALAGRGRAFNQSVESVPPAPNYRPRKPGEPLRAAPRRAQQNPIAQTEWSDLKRRVQSMSGSKSIPKKKIRGWLEALDAIRTDQYNRVKVEALAAEIKAFKAHRAEWTNR